MGWIVQTVIIVSVVAAIAVLIWWITRPLNKWSKIVQKGFDNMKGKKVVICGIARDIADGLPKNMSRLEQLGKFFNDYRIVVYENDSRDGTDKMLQNWSQSNPKVLLISEQLKVPSAIHQGGPLGVRRFQVLAECRNKYRNRIIQDDLKDFDYVIVFDLDLSRWEMEGIAHSFGLENWDVLFANGLGAEIYWDTLAFRDDKYTDTLHSDYQRNILHTLLMRKKFDPPVPANSGFGGIAIYPRKAFELCAYNGDRDCEHIEFYNCIKSKGLNRIFMNPAMIVRYW